MPMNELNLTQLQERINTLRTETSECTEFCIAFIECLMNRHHLQECVMDNFSMDDVPNQIIDTIRSGRIPSRESLMEISPEIQNNLCFELLWICGMGAMIELGAHINNDDNEDDESTLEIVVRMKSEGESSFIASYIIAALTLLTGRIPSQNLILALTNDLDSSPDQILKDMEIFVELAAGVLSRYQDELECK